MKDSPAPRSLPADCLALLLVLRLVILGLVAVFTAGSLLLTTPQRETGRLVEIREADCSPGAKSGRHWYDNFPAAASEVPGSPEQPFHGLPRPL